MFITIAFRPAWGNFHESHVSFRTMTPAVRAAHVSTQRLINVCLTHWPFYLTYSGFTSWFFSIMLMAGVCSSGDGTGHKDLLCSSRWPSAHPGGENIDVQSSLAELQNGGGGIEGSQIRPRTEGEAVQSEPPLKLTYLKCICS